MSASNRMGFFKTLGISLATGIVLAIAAFVIFTLLEGSNTKAQYEETAAKDAIGRTIYNETKAETEFEGKSVAWATVIAFVVGCGGVFLLNYVTIFETWIDRAMGVKQVKK